MDIHKLLFKKNNRIKFVRYLDKDELINYNKRWHLGFFLKTKILIRKIFNFFNKNIHINKSRSISNVIKKYDAGSGNQVLGNKDATYQYIGYWEDKKVARIQGRPHHQLTFFLRNLIKEKNFNSFLEVGAGELTTTMSLVEDLDDYLIKKSAAIDLSFKRVEAGKNYFNEKGKRLDVIARSNAKNLPFQDDTFNVSYTNYCLEQVPHLFDEIVDEIIRVTSDIIVLLEPSFEFGDKYTKNKIKIRNYPVINENSFVNKNCELLYRGSMPYGRYNNHGEIIVLKKKENTNKENLNSSEIKLLCPITKDELHKEGNFYISKKSNNKYPIKDDIPMLAEFDKL